MTALRETSRPHDASWIARLLEFQRDGDIFIAPQVTSGPEHRLFGGLVAAQALGAAGATVDPDKRAQSLHAYFVRGGKYGIDVELQVERTRDGRSFDTRRVTAIQDDKVILEMIASFHRPEESADWHPQRPATLALDDAVPKSLKLESVDRFELRTDPRDTSPFAIPPFWIRSREVVEDDPLIRACMLTYLSDLGPVLAARPAGAPDAPGAGMAASLDHSLWLHRPFDPHRWHRYEVTGVNNSDARGLAIGSLYDEDGRLIASTTQESLWRC
ncbi:acyl-CoA thioesterase II [Mycolicibacterium doricum]|uniref:Acyl-CoA thioesterase II n=1 Tax=Mycolicibacterium doricum TaxID=126673 RepID=A0A1X1TJ17_9MYCO|nr:acyl-CoA thioesterase domain-containing protein [Mycolicibacterium doricum]MCV7267938.1 thioesterase family protein [Mycolicibacterium doricum]ORV44508.1 acyl-CoA thioesterase II [Mycolicibacterium doricum]BBZ09202.1 acyl-CoA thioesterase II [Mycolicibacterium doricum]